MLKELQIFFHADVLEGTKPLLLQGAWAQAFSKSRDYRSSSIPLHLAQLAWLWVYTITIKTQIWLKFQFARGLNCLELRISSPE
jgi:hypothetical protein